MSLSPPIFKSSIFIRSIAAVQYTVSRLTDPWWVALPYFFVVLPLAGLVGFALAIGAIPGCWLHYLIWRSSVDTASEWLKVLHDVSLVFIAVLSAVLAWIYVAPLLPEPGPDDAACAVNPRC